MSAVQLIQADSVQPQAWRNGGGQTRELLVWPGANDWRLRISRADIEADGPFSAFAGVQRWFVVLSGYGVVLHMPTPDGHTLDHHLLPGHTPLHFDGGLAPGCSLIDGATQDLNLMARGGKAGMQDVVTDQPWPADFAMRGIYTACSGTWSDGLQAITLAAHSLQWVEHRTAAAMRFTANNTEPTRAWWLGYTPDTTP
jgi:environmental stress-induced protein Ves